MEMKIEWRIAWVESQKRMENGNGIEKKWKIIWMGRGNRMQYFSKLFKENSYACAKSAKIEISTCFKRRFKADILQKINYS